VTNMATAGVTALLLELTIYHERLKKAGAISYETRKSPQDINLTEKQLRMLVKMKYAQKTKDQKYYAVCKNGKHC